MAEASLPPPAMPEIPEAVPRPKRRWHVPLVWIIPLVAAITGGWIAIKTIYERGPTITMTFKTAEGLEAGKTRIKYKDVDIGEVKSVSLSEDRLGVVVTAELAKRAESFLVEDTRFWVVRPRIAAGGVSGLGTLLSGSHIGIDPGKSQQLRENFTGLEVAPVVTADLSGRQFVLQAEELASLNIGSPVYFRRLTVGEVVGFELDRDGSGVTVRVFINAPHDQYVMTDTRFWEASGIDVSLAATGVKVETQSLASIILGGIAFQTPAHAATASPADENAKFRLFADRALVMQAPDTESENYVFLFRHSVRGLAVSAPVDFRGVVIGEVVNIAVDYDAQNLDFAMAVEARIYPERLRARLRPVAGAKPPSPESHLNLLVEKGLRAQLRPADLLTGQLYVAVDVFPDAPHVAVDWSKRPVELPTAPATLEELEGTIARLARNLDKLPLDTIAADAQRVLMTLDRALESVETLVTRLDTDLAPEAGAALAVARRTFGAAESTFRAAERTFASDAPIQQDMRATLRELTRAAEALRVLADYLERHPESLLRGKPEEAR